MLFDLESLRSQVTAIQDGILFSKINVLSHDLLSVKEMEFVSKYLIEQNLGFSTLDQALDFATISIASRDDTILYTMNLPRLDNTQYKWLRVESLPKNRMKIILPSTWVLQGTDKIYAQVKEDVCRKVGTIGICERSGTVEIADSCLPNILKGLPSECHYVKTSMTPKITPMGNNAVLVTDGNYEMTNTCGTANRTLVGSYLISYSDCVMCLRHECFYDTLLKEYDHVVVPPTNGLNIRRKSLLHEADLGLLHESHLENLEVMSHMKEKTTYVETVVWSSGSILLILLLIAFAFIVNLIKRIQPTNLAVVLNTLIEKAENRRIAAEPLNQEVQHQKGG
jgi:hypothetical protein